MRPGDWAARPPQGPSVLYRFSPACLHGASSGRALRAPARKVKEKGVMVESARKIGDERAIVQGGRRAGWQVHPWPGRAPSAPGETMGAPSQAQGRPGGARGFGHTGRCDLFSVRPPLGHEASAIPPPVGPTRAGMRKREILALLLGSVGTGAVIKTSPHSFLSHPPPSPLLTPSHPPPDFGTVMPS